MRIKTKIIQWDLYNDDSERHNEVGLTDYLNQELDELFEREHITSDNIIDTKVNTVYIPMENVDVEDVRTIITIFYKVED